jgi:hypothetical protein
MQGYLPNARARIGFADHNDRYLLSNMRLRGNVPVSVKHFPKTQRKGSTYPAKSIL